MRNIKLDITASIDGFIAPIDGSFEWLIACPRPSVNDYRALMDSIDTVLMGGNTYRDLLCMYIIWPYEDQTTYVVTHEPILKR